MPWRGRLRVEALPRRPVRSLRRLPRRLPRRCLPWRWLSRCRLGLACQGPLGCHTHLPGRRPEHGTTDPSTGPRCRTRGPQQQGLEVYPPSSSRITAGLPAGWLLLIPPVGHEVQRPKSIILVRSSPEKQPQTRPKAHKSIQIHLLVPRSSTSRARRARARLSRNRPNLRGLGTLRLRGEAVEAGLARTTKPLRCQAR